MVRDVIGGRCSRTTASVPAPRNQRASSSSRMRTQRPMRRARRLPLLIPCLIVHSENPERFATSETGLSVGSVAMAIWRPRKFRCPSSPQGEAQTLRLRTGLLGRSAGGRTSGVLYVRFSASLLSEPPGSDELPSCFRCCFESPTFIHAQHGDVKSSSNRACAVSAEAIPNPSLLTRCFCRAWRRRPVAFSLVSAVPRAFTSQDAPT